MILIRNTFACNPAIAAADEANLAILMTERVIAEQKKLGKRPGALPAITGGKRVAENLILGVLSETPISIAEVGRRSGYSADHARHILNRLVLTQEVDLVRPEAQGTRVKTGLQMWTLASNPPSRGVSDPDGPGKEKGDCLVSFAKETSPQQVPVAPRCGHTGG